MQKIADPPSLDGERTRLNPVSWLVNFVRREALEDCLYRTASGVPDDADLDAHSRAREQEIDAEHAADWAITDTDGNWAGLMELTAVADEQLEAGYWIAEACRGNGYAADALKRVTRWVEEETTAERIDLLIPSENEFSIAVARDVGYQREEDRLVRTLRCDDGMKRVYSWHRGAA